MEWAVAEIDGDDASKPVWSTARPIRGFGQVAWRSMIKGERGHVEILLCIPFHH